MSDTQTANAKLFGKMAKIMAQIRILEKTGKNTFDKYDYVTADAIAIRIGKLMAENGLSFFPSMTSVETAEYITQKGTTNYRTVAHFQMTIACTETGATYTSMWSGEAIDRSDKSISKAATSAVKYYLLKTFLLAGGDDEDADATSPEVEARTEIVSKEQIDRLDEVGREFYKEKWETASLQWIEWATDKRTNDVEQLTPQQVGRIIQGIKKRMAKVVAA